MSTAPDPTGQAKGETRSEDDQLIDVVRDTVTQLEALTQRLNSYLENGEWGVGRWELTTSRPSSRLSLS